MEDMKVTTMLEVGIGHTSDLGVERKEEDMEEMTSLKMLLVEKIKSNRYAMTASLTLKRPMHDLTGSNWKRK